MRKIAVLIALVVCLAILWVMKPLILSSFLTSRLGVRVMIGSIDLGSSDTQIGDFKIKNPIGYKTRNAFRAEKTTISYQWKGLFGKATEIDQIEISDIFLSVEFDAPVGMKNNWTKILEHLPRHFHREKQLVIHKLILNNLTIEVRGLGGSGTQIKKVGSIELDEINSEDGFPTKELIKQIFGGAGIQQYLQGLINPANTIRRFFTPLFGDER